MAIKIIEDGRDVHLTRAEWERLMQEYRRTVSMMVDPPSFEVWVSKRMAGTVEATYPDWVEVERP